MRSDLYETLEFLSASLATGEPRLFNDYVQWRLDVLGFRSQQTVELVAALGLLAEFFAQRFGPISGVPVGLGYLRIAIGLVQPALYAVGQLWQRNEITVAQEHLACSITQALDCCRRAGDTQNGKSVGVDRR